MNIVLIGGGTMGAGIAAMLAYRSGFDKLTWIVRDVGTSQKRLYQNQKSALRLARKDSLDLDVIESRFESIVFTEVYDSCSSADLVIEAVAEDAAIKKAVYSKFSNLVSDHTLVASNTSSLSITDLSSSFKKSDRFIGLHFFNPPLRMALVEVVKGLCTSESTVAEALEFVRALLKKPVVVKDSPGFIVNRMLIPMINEAVAILSEGVASREAIDAAMMNGANHPIGPLALADMIGLDVCLSIMETLHSETGDPKYRPHYLLRKFVRAGMTGRKSGAGFYEY